MDITIILVSLIIALGGFTQGLTGFGLALVSVPLLSMTVDAKIAVPLASIFGWVVTWPIVWKMRHCVQYKTGLILFAGSIPASFVGAKLLATLPSQYIIIPMGIILIVSSLYALRSSKPLFRHTSTSVTFGTGFTSGVLGASVGDPGPPVIAYTSMLPWTADQSKSTLAFFFMLQMVNAIISFWVTGLITVEVTFLAVSAIPLFLVGTIAGMVSYHLLQKHKINYHHLVHALLLIIGCMLILKQLFI
ncbi:MAG: sulfite exporter TauE/SafE family protein [Endozoicomonadaceae bacterium]|nr:sulfite exporter TauE/SafE family protein [Endozoicomonadaceae bacterium]